MTCQQLQTNLSLYLYGELDFAQEDALEHHLDGCAFCQLALAREKEWHSALNAEQADVPLTLLSECRRELSRAVGSSQSRSSTRLSWWSRFSNFSLGLGLRGTRWSLGLAAASFLVFVGFTAARFLDRTGASAWPLSEASMIDPATMHVRDIQPDGKDGVHLVIDQTRERNITGRVDNDEIRRLLLSAMQDPTDPGIRVYSVEVLKGQHGSDIRDALIKSATHDPNAGVRLKALDGLRQFTPDSETVGTLKYVLEHDNDPGVRSEAIDVLARAGQSFQSNSDLAGTLQEIMRSGHEDDYVRGRCLQMLREMNAPINVY